MAEYKGKQGHWVTTKEGRHLFIEEDAIDRQERQIKEREEQTKKFTAEQRGEDTIEGGHNYPEIAAEDVVDALVEEWQDFSYDEQDSIPGDLYAKDDLSANGNFSDADIDKIMAKDLDYNLACRFMAWYATRDISKPYTKAKVAQALNGAISNGAQLDDKAITAIMKYIK